jgi:hypothetical protein
VQPHRTPGRLTAGTGGLDEVPGSEALKSTASRRPLPTPLHQYPSSNLSEGLIGSDERPEAVGQLQLPLGCVDVSQRGAEDHRITRQSTILREQQCLAGRTCVEVAGRTLLRLRKPSVGSAAAKNHPKTARRAAQDGRPRRRWRPGSSCGDRAGPPFNPSPAALRRRNGRAPPPMSAIASSQALYATLQGQQEQRGAGAPSSSANRCRAAELPEIPIFRPV